jgi:tetratricopeptide (TPR) repeat protein
MIVRGTLGLAFLVLLTGLPARAAEAKEPPACVIGDQALAQGQPGLAVTQYQRCLANTTPTFQILSNIGMAYAQSGQFEQAVQLYTQALAFDPQNPPILLNLGLAYLKSNHVPEAARAFARSLMGDPSNMRALELLAVCHYQMKEYALAAYEAEQVLKSKPKEDSASFLLGSSLLRLGIYRQALTLLYSSVESSKSADAHMVLGQAFLGIKVYGEALKQFQEAETLNPKLDGIHANLATAMAGQGETGKAIAEYKLELAKHPENFEANYMLGRLDRLSNNMAEARKYLDKANSLRPGDPSVNYEYAVLAMQSKDYAKAASLLENIVQQEPDYLDAHVLLAEVYFHMHKKQEGMREKALVDAMKNAQDARYKAEGKAMQEAYTSKNPSSSSNRR